MMRDRTAEGLKALRVSLSMVFLSMKHANKITRSSKKNEEDWKRWSDNYEKTRTHDQTCQRRLWQLEAAFLRRDYNTSNCIYPALCPSHCTGVQNGGWEAYRSTRIKYKKLSLSLSKTNTGILLRSIKIPFHFTEGVAGPRLSKCTLQSQPPNLVLANMVHGRSSSAGLLTEKFMIPRI